MITVNFNPLTDDKNIALGNHMFQYVVCRIVAEKNSYNFYIPHKSFISQCFENIDLGEKNGEILHNYIESADQTYDPNIFSVSDFTNLVGYFQTEKYFLDYEDDVKMWFKPTLDSKTKSIIDKYPISKYCYIHLRGGDYRINGSLLPKEYFDRAIEKVKEIKSDLSFVVVTDDLELSKSYFPNFDAISNEVITDFKTLYFSNFSIISNSSFSWWSCWLTDKEITIAPNNWLYYNNPAKDIHPKDIKTNKFIFI
jgi:hypothetical protein